MNRRRVPFMERDGLIGAYMAYFSNQWTGEIEYIQEFTAQSIKEFYENPLVQVLLENDVPNTAGKPPSAETYRRASMHREVAWGPACWQTKTSNIADNTMVVVRDPVFPSHLTVCVCGTHPLSLFSWIFNDLAVFTPIQWPFKNSPDSEEECQTPRTLEKSMNDLLGLSAETDEGSDSESSDSETETESAGSLLDSVDFQRSGSFSNWVEESRKIRMADSKLVITDFVDRKKLAQSMRVLNIEPEDEMADMHKFIRSEPPRPSMTSPRDGPQKPMIKRTRGGDLTALMSTAKTNAESAVEIEQWQKNMFVSRGTMIGLKTLLDMRDPHTKKTLIEFLLDETVANHRRKAVGGKEWEPVSILFTGHSLGGALSPCLALCVHDRKREWDAYSDSIIYCSSFAGPTFGNETIARYYDSVLGKTSLRIANDLDVVTHAWSTNSLKELKDIYAPKIRTPFLLTGAARAVISMIKNIKYSHICKDQRAFVLKETDGSDFVVAMCLNHSRTYLEHAGLEILAPIFGERVPLYNGLFCGEETTLGMMIKEVFTLTKFAKKKRDAKKKKDKEDKEKKKKAKEEREREKERIKEEKKSKKGKKGQEKAEEAPVNPLLVSNVLDIESM